MTSRNVPRKKKKKKYREDVKNKRAEVTGGELHTMFTSSGEEPSGTELSELGEDDDFTWH